MSLTFTAGDISPSPLEKPGYRLEFHDEFDGPRLDTARWLPFYLPQWSSRARSAPNYVFEEGCLVFQITAEQPPWCPEFDGENRCSCVQTGVFSGPLGSAIGQSRFNERVRVREAQAPARTYTPQYGYFELRARGTGSPNSHVALWMIGYEDQPERSAEICICEIMGAHVSPSSSRVGYGVHRWYDPAMTEEFYQDFFGLDAARFHIYAAEWRPEHIDFYIDRQKVRTVRQSPRYPMQFMLGMFEVPRPGAARDPAEFPKRFAVDYFRAYQPVEGYRG
jgi:hypothetical protein